jgi:1,4-dihydroxy-2-naphthoate octaprenyltransferase
MVPAPDLYPNPSTSLPGWRRWWIAARPRTLTMSVTPVLVGTVLAWSGGSPMNWPVFALTLACAILIQVATNLLNDVSDFERGNDRNDRVGPVRITAAGLATPAEVRRAATLVLIAAAGIGSLLVWIGGPAILAVGVFSIVAGWAYSGGSKPVSHGALGELWVLTFFGVVAVCGSYYLQAHEWSAIAVLFGLAIGAMAAAVLLLNNYRDLGPDKIAGRRTLAAVLGQQRSQLLFALLMLLPLLLPASLALADRQWQWLWLSWLALPLLVSTVVRMRRLTGRALNPVLGQTAMAQLVFGALLTVGLLL